jgi:hypothetical protein
MGSDVSKARKTEATMGFKPKAFKPKLSSSHSDHDSKKRHGSAGPAKALGRAAHVSKHSSTHMKSRMKRFT